MLASLITLLVAVGTLFILLCNVAITGFFLRSSPRGDSAMGLLVPFVGLIIASLLITLASVLTAARSGRAIGGVLNASPTIAGGLVVVVTFGVVLAAFLAFCSWGEGISSAATPALRVLMPIMANLAGFVAPLLLAIALIAAAWMTLPGLSDQPQRLAAVRAGFGVLAVVALAGYAVGGTLVAIPAFKRLSATRAAEASMTPQERAARDRFRHAPVEQLLAEELAKYPADAPLSQIVVYFDPSVSPRKLNDACKGMLIERALAVPDLDQQLIDCMRQKQYNVPRGAAELVRAAPKDLLIKHQVPWSRAVAAGIEATADAMTIRPAWLTETFDAKPDPLGHVTSLLAAAERFKGLPSEAEVASACRTLAESARELNRDAKWKALARELKHAGYAVPDDSAAPSHRP